MSDLKQIVNDYYNDGYAVIPDFLNTQEIDDLKSECEKIVNNMDMNECRSIFKTGDKQLSNEYFMNSADKIRFFAESDAFDDDGNLIVDKSQSLNKIGHALHWWNPVFKRITFSEKIKNIVQEIGFVDPRVTQSMYIFKNPRIGGKVIPHQDGSFLHTEQEIRVLGLWFALEDATLENGCLWFIPGSHSYGLKTQWIRNNDTPVAMIFTEKMPQYDDKEYVPVPVAKGSCVLIHGLVIHKSENNKSDKPRPIYTFHVYDQHETIWNEKNWLQQTLQLPFPSLYRN